MARANPSDRSAAWQYAQALERRGDRRGHLVALSGLARSGDAHAETIVRDVLALPPPGPNRSHTRKCGRLREPWRMRSASLDGSFRGVLASTERLLLLRSADALIVADPLGLVELWRRPLPEASPVALRGEDIVLGEGSDLVLLDGQTGRELVRKRMRGPIAELVADLDRAVILTGANEGRLWLLVGVDLGENFGRELWRVRHAQTPPEPTSLYGILGDVVIIRRPLGALRTDDGKPDAQGAEMVRRLDYHGGLGDRRARLEASFGGWGFAVASDPNVSQTMYDNGALEVISPDGRRRVDLPVLRPASSPQAALLRMNWSVSVAESLGYLVSTANPMAGVTPPGTEVPRVDWDVVNVIGVDLVKASICLNVGLPVDLHGEFHTVDGIALDGALLVVVATPGECTLVRFEGSVPAGG